MPYAMGEKVEEELKRLVGKGALEPVQVMDWASPIVLVLTISTHWNTHTLSIHSIANTNINIIYEIFHICNKLFLSNDNDDGTLDQYALPVRSVTMNTLSLTLYASFIKDFKACLSESCRILVYSVVKS